MVIASENVIDVLTRFGSEASLKAWEEWEFGFVYVRSLRCLYGTRALTSFGLQANAF